MWIGYVENFLSHFFFDQKSKALSHVILGPPRPYNCVKHTYDISNPYHDEAKNFTKGV